MQARLARTCQIVVLLPLVILITVSHAETLVYGVDAGVGETDNVTLAHDAKISQTIAVTDFDIDYQKKSPLLDVDARGNFSYLDYVQGAYGSKLFGRFDGSADLALIPQRLTWVLQEDFGQAAVNPFTPTTPTNVENINSVATGPELYLRLNGASYVDASARVAHIQYDISPYTNSRASGSLAWGLKLSPLSSVSLNGDTQRVVYENTMINTDFERSDGFVRYELQGARTELAADVGATVIDEGGRSTTGSLAKFKLTRRLSAVARLTATLGHVGTDGSTKFAGGPQGVSSGLGTSPAVNTSANYVSSYVSAGWEFQRNRTTIGVNGRWERDNYAGLATLDRTITSADVRLQRLLTRALTLQFDGTLNKSDYGNAILNGANGSPKTTTGLIAAAVTWHHGRALEVKVACEHTTYTTSPYDIGYRENRIFLTIGYRPVRQPAVGEVVPGT